MPLIPAHVPRPAYTSSGGKSPWADIIPLAYPIGPDSWYDKHLEKGVRNACRTTAECLQYAVSLVKQGVTTSEIEKKVTEWALSRDFYPSSLNYGTFPGSLCTSVNNVLAHGVPDEYAIFPAYSANFSQILLEGTIVNLDIALYVRLGETGFCYHGDTSTTVAVGGEKTLSPQSRRLLEATKMALDAGIAACGPFKPYNGIGKAIASVAREYGMSIVKELVGHGIGKEYHQYPVIVQYDNDDPGEMVPGTVFTIEPCLTEGSGEYETDPTDGWSLYSVDGARGAQEEHTVLITDTGVEVLTRIAKD